MKKTISPVVSKATELREKISPLADKIKAFVDALEISETEQGADKEEQIANAMLSYRHIEDAKTRLDKVIQATVGKSVYDK